MFFSTELLLKRESGLGLLWLAATIGSKASFKKLNKKSILSADISKLCDMIAEPEEPLALRLSSNLLVGVARVHRAQHEIFYNDVMTCFITLKRAFAEITSAENQLQGSLTLSKDQLTLRETGFDIELDVLDTVWIDPLPRQPTPLPSQDDVLPHATFERPPFRHSQSAQSAGERQRLNPLADNALDFSGPSDDPFREQDEPFFDGDQADMIEMDLGLDFGDNGDQHAIHFGENGYYDEFQPLNDERERDVTASRHASAMNTPVRARRETEASSGQRNPKTPVSELVFGNPALPDVSSSGNASHSQFHESAFAVEVSPPAVEPDPKPKGLRKKRKQHPDMLLWDKKIELTEEELLRNREGYEERMKKERREVLAKQRRFEAANLVQSMMQGPLLGAVDPGLVSWYKGLVKAQHDTFSANGRVQIDDGFAVPALPKKRRKVASKDKEDAVIEPLDVPPAEVDALNWFPSDDTNGGGVPFDDNMDWMQDVPGGQDLGSAEPEHGRRGSSVPSSDLGSHLTRKTQLKPASQRGSNPPWDQDADVPPLNEMMNTPGKMRRTRSLSVVQVGREDGNAIDAEGSFTFEEEAATNGARDTQDDSQMTDMSLITMQRTMEVGSAKFLTHLVTAVDPATKAISFDKYLTPGVIDRRVAAMGFYHVLDLATKHRIRAIQPNAYGSIKLTIL